MPRHTTVTASLVALAFAASLSSLSAADNTEGSADAEGVADDLDPTCVARPSLRDARRHQGCRDARS